MSRPRYLIFGARSPGGVRKYQDLVKIFLVVLGCLSVGLHIVVLLRSSLDSPAGCSDHAGLAATILIQNANQNHKSPTQSSSESQRSSSDQNSLVERIAGDKRFPVEQKNNANNNHHRPEPRIRRRTTLSSTSAAAATGNINNNDVDAGQQSDVILDDSVGRRAPKDYKLLWRYYRMTANVSSSPYARPRQPVSPYRNMAEAYASNGR